ncbi:MAG: CBS domain-containing protein, partial [Clostridia bacterium]|nr:CBS domain-containing protein [Clostridia bacterium]
FDFYRSSQLEEAINQIKTVILVDINELTRVDFAQRAVQSGAELIIYDHHPYHDEKYQFKGIIEPVGATSTLLVELLRQEDITLNPIEATVLAIGIYQDTGSLRFLGTTHRDAQALAYLLAAGANLTVVNTFLERPLNMEQQQLYNLLMANAEEKWINGNQVLVAGGRTNKYVGGIALISRKLGEVYGADAVILAVSSPKQVDLVARSRVDWIRIDQLMRAFGGGGHAKAGSAKVKSAQLEEVLQKLDNMLPDYISPPLTAKDLMSSPVKSIKPEQTISEAAKLLLRYGHSGMPVVDEEEKLVGIISRRDVDKAMHHNLGHAPVKAYMSRHVKTVTPDTPVTQIEDMMISNDIGRLPVCDQNILVGIVSRTDLLRTVHQEYQGKFSTNFRSQCPVLGVDIKELLLQRMEPDLLSLLQSIGRIGERRDERTFLVGGIVRDLIIGCPNIDIDIVVEGDGPELARELAEEVGAKVRVHDIFQTATVVIPNGYQLDIVSARTEFYAYPAALPTVESARIREDLYRRDFTVNAMAISLNLDSFGTLVDYFCGYSDVKEGLIRVLHNLSFVEDPTRIIRAIRFSCKYGWQIEEETYGFMVRALKEGRLKAVSLPRLWQELKQILTEDNPVPALSKLAELGADKQIMKGIEWNRPVLDALTLGRQAILQLKSAYPITPWRIYLAILLSPYSLDQLRELLNTLVFNKKNKQAIEDVFSLVKNLPFERVMDDNFIMTLHHHCRQIAADTITAWAALSGSAAVVQKICTYLTNREKLKPRLSGSDLLALGAKRGPGIGAILKRLEMAWLTGEITGPGEELSLAKELIREGSNNAHV